MANLTQLRVLENLNGFLLIDKPSGISFSTVIKTVKRKFNLVKVGHGGALETSASGLLILLINDANKFVADVMGADRAYEGTLRLGVTTNTHDSQGEILAKNEARPDDETWARALREWRGDVFQTESRFCAVRRENVATYEIADTGDHQPFMTHVYKFDVSREKENDVCAFSLVATKNILVRTLVNDFGASLGCGATLETLCRTRVGKFGRDRAIPFQTLLEADLANFANFVLPLAKALA